MRRPGFLGTRRAQEPRGHKGDGALQHAEEEERVLEAGRLDHRRNGQDRGRRARAVAAGGQANCQPAPVREPFQGVVDAGGIDRPDANPAHCRAEVEARQGGGLRVDDPGRADEQRAERHHQAWAKLVDEVALHRREPGLDQHEQRERHLDLGAWPAVGLLDFRHEQRPGVLDVGRGHHADDAKGELDPAGPFRCLLVRGECGGGWASHGALPGSFVVACPAACLSPVSWLRCALAKGINRMPAHLSLGRSNTKYVIYQGSAR
ncbi:hypothetical protein D3C72_1300780 [compost metagenome]